MPAGEGAEGAAAQPRGRRWPFEAALVALSPLAVYFVLRVRAMTRPGLPDPGMHTIYIIDPRDVYMRYSTVFAAAHFREGARVGFLVPARLAYLVFGAVPGFFAMRYFLALVAIVPAYVLLRRLYGVTAGAVAVIVLLSSPVIITAWGTDYPDSAAVSYMAGALACLAMPSPRRRRAWVVAGGGLLTLALWSHAATVPLVGATLIAYALVLALRDRSHLLRDAGLLLAAAAGTTGLLAGLSALELGRANFVALTLASWSFLSSKGVVDHFHSASWAWAPYRAYLLVLPAVVLAWAVTFARRLPDVSTPKLLVGVACAAQILVAAYLQFFGDVEMLEMRFFSSILWGAVCLTFAVTICELARPLFAGRATGFVPAAVVLAVPLAYEAGRHSPAFSWWPVGALLAVAVVAAAAAGRAWDRRHKGASAAAVVAIGGVLVVMTGASLYLTVAPIPKHGPIENVVGDDPPTTYDSALGASAARLVDNYRIAAALPAFVGNATYRGEQLMTWHPPREGHALLEAMGLYLDGLNGLFDFPHLTPFDRDWIARRRPAQILFASIATSARFPVALDSLARYRPLVVRKKVIRSGPLHLNVWLVELRAFARAP